MKAFIWLIPKAESCSDQDALELGISTHWSRFVMQTLSSISVGTRWLRLLDILVISAFTSLRLLVIIQPIVCNQRGYSSKCRIWKEQKSRRWSRRELPHHGHRLTLWTSDYLWPDPKSSNSWLTTTRSRSFPISTKLMPFVSSSLTWTGVYGRFDGWMRSLDIESWCSIVTTLLQTQWILIREWQTVNMRKPSRRNGTVVETWVGMAPWTNQDWSGT